MPIEQQTNEKKQQKQQLTPIEKETQYVENFSRIRLNSENYKILFLKKSMTKQK